MEVEDIITQEFYSLSDILPYLLENHFLSEIECRKIACARFLKERHAAIYQTVLSKNQQLSLDILEIFRNNIYPLVNPKILKRIFGFLDFKNTSNCRLVCQKWNAVAQSLLKFERNVLPPPPTATSFSGCDSACPELPLLLENEDLQFIKTRKLLQNMVVKQIISKTQYLKIDETTDLTEMQGSLFDILLSKNPLEGNEMIKICRQSQNVEELVLQPIYSDNDSLQSSAMSKAMQNNAILNHLFHVSKLKHLKKYRLVCRQWNSVVEPFLRKRGRVCLNDSFPPTIFVEVFTLFPKLPFTAFKFGDMLYNEKLKILYPKETYDVAAMDLFFERWGRNVRSLQLWNINLVNEEQEHMPDVTLIPWLSEMPHLTELSIIREDYTNIQLDLEKLQSIKILTLAGCHVSISNDVINRRITPEKITLLLVCFYLEENLEDEIYLNDFIDFSKATEINVHPHPDQKQNFDLARDQVNAETIRFDNTTFENWGTSRVNGNFVIFKDCDFIERNGMQFKYLCWVPTIRGQGKFITLDVSLLPATIEQMWIAPMPQTPEEKPIIMNAPIELPNLNYLLIQLLLGCPADAADVSFISYFANCPKLSDIEIQYNRLLKLDLSWIPKSVLVLKLSVSDIEFIGEEVQHIQIDTLEMNGNFNFCRKVVSKIQSKILVMCWTGSREQGKKDTIDDALTFILENQQYERILIYCRCLYDISYPFEKSQMFNYVDKKADYYEFVNQRGKAITRARFHEFTNDTLMDDRMSCVYDAYKYKSLYDEN